MSNNLIKPIFPQIQKKAKGIDYLRAYRALIKGYIAASIELELKKATDTKKKPDDKLHFTMMSKGK